MIFIYRIISVCHPIELTKALAEQFLILPSLYSDGSEQSEALCLVHVLGGAQADDLQQCQHAPHLKELCQEMLTVQRGGRDIGVNMGMVTVQKGGRMEGVNVKGMLTVQKRSNGRVKMGMLTMEEEKC